MDALVYVGWQGTAAPGGGYDESHLKAVLQASKLRELFNDFLPRLVTHTARKNPGLSQALGAFTSVAGPMTRHPTAFFFAGMNGEGPRAKPRLGLLCQAGPDAPALLKQIQDLINSGDAPPDLSARLVGDLLVVTSGYEPDNSVGGPDRAAKLRQNPAFSGSMETVRAQTSWVSAYVDTTGLFALVASNIPAGRDREQFDKVLAATGLSGMKSIGYAAGFDGREWMSRSFVDAPAPRVGLLTVCDTAPVSTDALKLIPSDATFALVAKFDFAKVVKETRIAVEKVDPEAAKMFDRGVGGMTMALGRQLLPDLLEPLGEDWAIYNSPTVGGTGITGFVVVNTLDDPAKLRQNLPAASVSLSNWIGVAMSRSEAREMVIAGQSVKVDGRNVFYMGLPIVSPAWTIVNDKLLLGLNTQSVIAGARRVDSKEPSPSILDNPKFVALQDRLGVKNPTSVSFYDLPTSAAFGGGYQQLLILTGYAGFGDLFGVPVKQPLLPPLDVLLQNLKPAGGASWSDPAGFHAVSISPFPGSLLVSEQGSISSMGVGGGAGALMASLIPPTLNRTRETANRIKCASNMRVIGQGILLYAIDNRFNYPPDLGTLILTKELTAHVFLCPSSNSSLPADLNTMTPQQIATWVNENSDYVYIGQGLNTSVRDDRPVLYEKPGAHDGDGMNILFGDGHVEFQPRAQAEETINNALKPDDGGL